MIAAWQDISLLTLRQNVEMNHVKVLLKILVSIGYTFLITPVRWFSMQIYNRTVLKNTNSPSHSTYFEKEKEYQISIYFTEIKLHDDF